MRGVTRGRIANLAEMRGGQKRGRNAFVVFQSLKREARSSILLPLLLAIIAKRQNRTLSDECHCSCEL